MSSAIHQEYEEGLQALGEPRMRFYKLLSMFSFENGNEIHVGDGIATFCSDKMHYDQLKEYIKEQKRWVRTETPDPSEIRLRTWWLLQKLIEFGLFTASELRILFTTP